MKKTNEPTASPHAYLSYEKEYRPEYYKTSLVVIRPVKAIISQINDELPPNTKDYRKLILIKDNI